MLLHLKTKTNWLIYWNQLFKVIQYVNVEEEKNNILRSKKCNQFIVSCGQFEQFTQLWKHIKSSPIVQHLSSKLSKNGFPSLKLKWKRTFFFFGEYTVWTPSQDFFNCPGKYKNVLVWTPSQVDAFGKFSVEKHHRCDLEFSDLKMAESNSGGSKFSSSIGICLLSYKYISCSPNLY